MHTTRKIGASALLCMLLAAGCATRPPSPGSFPAGGDGGAMRGVAPLSGPKTTIAVGKIDAVPGMGGPFGMTQAGAGVASMLTTALSRSGRFIVTERDDLAHVLTEQDLFMNGRSRGQGAPTPGAIVPAQYVVVGAVTELSTGDAGAGTASSNGAGINVGFPLRFGLLPSLSLNDQKGRIAFDLRLVNTRTGLVEDTFTVSKELHSVAVGVSVGWGLASLGGNLATSSPLGETMRQAMDEAAARIASDVAVSAPPASDAGARAERDARVTLARR
jgi:curli biogenesis system outer membrane secretion channel CsgG